MDLFFNAFTHGVGLLADPILLVVIFCGTLWGTIGGGHPGGSAVLTISVVIPVTFLMSPIQAVAFLLAILVGVNYGNSIPAILLGLPGTPSAFLTSIDGYELHRKGKSGLALGVMFISSLTGQMVSIFFFVALVVPLAMMTYAFLEPEFFALYLLGVSAVVSLLGKDLLKGYLSAALGLAVTTIGSDPRSVVQRFAGTNPDLRSGLEPVAVLLGLLAVSEVLRHMRQIYDYEKWNEEAKITFPKRSELGRIVRPIALGSLIGTLTGATPGAAATVGAVISYNQAKQFSKFKDEFGHGSIEGIAANEAAQNAAQAGDMIPTLGLGIPAGPTTALILAAVMIHGIVPGPNLLHTNPELLYAAVAGLMMSTIFLLVIGWPVAKIMAKLVSLNRSVVTVLVLVLILIGVFALNESIFDDGVCLVFGIIGYYMRRYGFSVAAAALATILGAGLELNLRVGLGITDNNLATFATRPITAVILILVFLFLGLGIFQSWRGRRPAKAPAA